jgi:hypothetical protein
MTSTRQQVLGGYGGGDCSIAFEYIAGEEEGTG